MAYWNEYGHEIEEVEKALEEAKTKLASADDDWQLDRYTRSLRLRVKSRLQKTFNRLKNDIYYAYVLLYEASVYRCAVKETWWLSHLEDWDLPKDWNEDKSQQMLDTLRDRLGKVLARFAQTREVSINAYKNAHDIFQAIGLETWIKRCESAMLCVEK